MSCSFWYSSKKIWSSEGCRVENKDSNRDQTVCECNHFTNFAAILDDSGRYHKFTQKYILALICLSILLLSSTIMIIIKQDAIIFKISQAFEANMNKKARITRKRDEITANQCVCLIFCNVILVFGLDRNGPQDYTSDVSILIISFSCYIIQFFD